MFCNQCGNQVQDDAIFCNKCGFRVKEETKMGSIIFRREGQYYGCLVPVKVFMDSNQVASLSAGQEACIPATVGKHQVMFNLWSGNGADEVEVTKEHPNIKVIFKLGVGVITSKPKIISILNV